MYDKGIDITLRFAPLGKSLVPLPLARWWCLDRALRSVLGLIWLFMKSMVRFPGMDDESQGRAVFSLENRALRSAPLK